MKDIGKEANIMDKVCIKHQVVQNTMENGVMVNIMEQEHSSGQMAAFIKVNGETAEKMEKENFQE